MNYNLKRAEDNQKITVEGALAYKGTLGGFKKNIKEIVKGAFLDYGNIGNIKEMIELTVEKVSKNVNQDFVYVPDAVKDNDLLCPTTSIVFDIVENNQIFKGFVDYSEFWKRSKLTLEHCKYNPTFQIYLK